MSYLNHDALVISENAERALPEMSPWEKAQPVCRRAVSFEQVNGGDLDFDLTYYERPEPGFVRVLVECHVQFVYGTDGPGVMADVYRNEQVRMDVRECAFLAADTQFELMCLLYQTVGERGASSALVHWVRSAHHDFDFSRIRKVQFYDGRPIAADAKPRRGAPRGLTAKRAPKRFDSKGAPRLDTNEYGWMARAKPGVVIEGRATVSGTQNGKGIAWTPETRREHVRRHAYNADRFQAWTSLATPSIATSTEPVYLRAGHELISVGSEWAVLLADLVSVLMERFGHDPLRLPRAFNLTFKNDWHPSVSRTVRRPTEIGGSYFSANMNAAWHAECIDALCREFRMGQACVAFARHD